jgi:hypothetical protein
MTFCVGIRYVDACFAGLFYDNTTLAHQMPLASAVRHITEIEKGKRPRFSPTNGAVVAQFDVQVDNQDMKSRQDSDPLAALGATLIMSAVSPKQSLADRNLENLFIRQVKIELGGSNLF